MRYFLCFILFATSFVHASPDSVVLMDVPRYDLSHRLRYMQDESNKLDIVEVLSLTPKQWTISNQSNTSFGYSAGAYWVHVPFNVEHSALWYVWLRYAPHDDVQFHWVQNGQVIEKVQTGDALNYDTRDVKVHDFAFSRFLNAGENIDVYVRIKTQGSYRIPLEIRQKSSFEKASVDITAFHGFYYGVLFVMSVYNLVLYFITGLRSYLFYVFYVFTSIFSRMSVDGMGFQFLWPNFPILNEWAIPISFWLSASSFGVFSYSFLNIKKAGGKINLYFWALAALFVAMGLCLPWMDYKTSVGLLTLAGCLLLVSALSVSIYLALSGRKYAGVFAVATIMSALAYIFSVMEAAGLYTDQTMMVYSYPSARMFEVVLFAIALGVRIRFLQNRRLEAEHEASVHHEKSLKNMELYERLYNSAMTGNFVLDTDGKVKSANRTFYEILSMKGVHTAVQAHDENIQEYFNQNIGDDVLALCSNSHPKIEKELNAISGSWVSLMVNKVDINDDHTYECSIIDISDRIKSKKLEEQAETDKMQALQQLVVGISHEVNTPLGIVKTSSDFARTKFEAIKQAINDGTLSKDFCEEQLKDGDDALLLSEHNIERLAGLIQTFKEVSVEQMGYKTALLDLESLIDRLNDDASNLGVPLTVNLSGYRSAQFITFTEAIYKVFYEIIVNAAEHGATEKGMKLSVEQSDKGLFVHVRDYGEGVKDETLNHIFEPFFTTGRGIQKKLGLGLYQVQNIVMQLLQGEIKAYNKDGLHFEIYVPNPEAKKHE